MPCSHCGHINPAGVKFCSNCGHPLTGATIAKKAATPGYHPPVSSAVAGSEITRLLHIIRKEPTGLAAGTLVWVLCLGVAWIGWTPLSWLPRFFGSFIPEGNCIGQTPGTFMMYICSAKVAMLTVVGSLLFLVLIFILRIPIKRGVKQLKGKIPEDARFLISPLFATLVFVAAWAGVHFSLEAQVGIVSQRTFPVLIGLFTFFVAQYGGLIQKAFRPVFVFRDHFPRWIRYGAAFLIPICFSLVITFEDRVTQEALKEQATVLLALCTGFLVLTPLKEKMKNKPAAT